MNNNKLCAIKIKILNLNLKIGTKETIIEETKTTWILFMKSLIPKTAMKEKYFVSPP